MYSVHLATSTVFQKAKIPFTNSAFVLGFTSRRIYSFNSCQRFSIGFKSGDSAGVFHQLISLFSKKSLAIRDVCFGSLSYIYRGSSGKTLFRKGTRVRSRIDTNSTASIVPSNTQIGVGPFLLIPAHTCTFTGCLGL